MPADDLERVYRWGWLPLIGGCVAVTAAMLAASELLFIHYGFADPTRLQRVLHLVRGAVMSFALALFAGWYMLRLRQRVEAARESLRAQQAAFARRAWKTEQAVGLGALCRLLVHEISDPINGLSLHCRLLERAAGRMEPTDAEPVRRIAAQLRDDTERLQGLAASYVEGNRAPGSSERYQDLSLEEIVRAAVAAHPCPEGVEIVVEAASDLAPVHAEPDRLRQLVEYLLRNAIDPPAGSHRVRVSMTNDGNRVLLAVADDGAGFEDPASVFRPFYPASSLRASLGLAIVRDVAREHGGDTRAANREGGGALLRVRLPMGERTS